MNRNPLVAPVVKWAGGKRQLLREIIKHLPSQYDKYYEPFVGGGALLFYLQPKMGVINDINEELINVYQVIASDVEGLIKELGKHRNEREYFYRIRQLDREPEVYQKMTNLERAARTIYLNKTCYNGLFRVNRRGEFNVPFGRYENPKIVDKKTLRAVSQYFNQAQIIFQSMDFADVVKEPGPDSFVYFDPPYDPLSLSANFTSYDRQGFHRQEQIRLKNLCDQLNEQGVKFLLSNSATDFILGLYGNYRIIEVEANRAINSKGNKRGKVKEVLVKNYN